jgi:hypothetical protein
MNEWRDRAIPTTEFNALADKIIKLFKEKETQEKQ